jgi:hypothetical protein
MADTRRFKFHGHAAALSGRIVRVGEGAKAKFIKNAFIDLPAAALPATGGRSSAKLSSKHFTDKTVRSFVRFQDATVSSEGVFEDARGHFEVTQGKRASNTLTPMTRVSAEIRGLDIGLKGQGYVRMTIKRVRGGFTSKKNIEAGESAIQLTKETGFDGNSVTFVDEKGKPYALIVGIAKEMFDTHDTFSAITAAPDAGLARSDDGAAHGTVVKPLKWKGREFPGSAIDLDRPNTVSIPGFGRVFFGEITLAPQSRRLTMVRLDLGSPIGGDCACADVMDNGSVSL